MISYEIFLNPNAHIYHVTLEFIPDSAKHQLKLPTWIPGSYMQREFSKNIINLTAIQLKQNISCIQIDKSTWSLSCLVPGSSIKISYNVYAYEFGIRTAFIDNTRGYFNSTSLCLYVVGQELSPHKLKLKNLPLNWSIATGLTLVGPGHFLAASYDELIDCPVELGSFTRLEFEINDIKHYFVLSGTVHPNFDAQRFIADISKICKTQIDLFGGTAPFRDYTFLLYLGGDVYTGLEHRNSTLLMAPYYSLPVLQQIEINDDYLKLLGLISHEFFHTWNVKRIKPQTFNPYDLQCENYTKLLWWFEGITSYYDDLILRRAGLINDERYLNLITNNINAVYKYNGAKEQTLTNGSLTSWVKYYRPDENSPNALVSYYVKGSLVGMCLDLLIRIKSKSLKSLDHVMYGLFKKWQNDGLGIGEDQLPKLIYEYTGFNLANEIEYFVDSCLELPYDKLLCRFGVTTHTNPKACYLDNGQVIKASSELPKKQKLDLGCKLIKDSIGYKVCNVYSGSLAEQIGLGANDILIALNNIKLIDIDKQLSLYKIGDKLEISLFRQEKLINIGFEYRYSAINVVYLQISDQSLLSNWL